jgi:hypothetical protein
MTDAERKVTRSFRLFGEKSRVLVFNTPDDDPHPARLAALEEKGDSPHLCEAPSGPFRQMGTVPFFPPVITIPAGLELELARMSPEDRAEFEREMGVGGTDRDAILRTLLVTSGQRLFLTAGEKEVRTWLLPAGGTALDAAAAIHSDLARGFIRAEVINYPDLVRLGSEREIRSRHMIRQEPKDYVIQDDDVILIRFSV